MTGPMRGITVRSMVLCAFTFNIGLTNLFITCAVTEICAETETAVMERRNEEILRKALKMGLQKSVKPPDFHHFHS